VNGDLPVPEVTAQIVRAIDQRAKCAVEANNLSGGGD
jgi:hypothetical protein